MTAVHVEESRVGHTPRNGHSKAQLTKAVENLRSHLCFWKKHFGIILHKPYPNGNMKGIFRNQRSGMPSLPPRTTPSWEVTSQILNTSRGNEPRNQSINKFLQKMDSIIEISKWFLSYENSSIFWNRPFLVRNFMFWTKNTKRELWFRGLSYILRTEMETPQRDWTSKEKICFACWCLCLLWLNWVAIIYSNNAKMSNILVTKNMVASVLSCAYLCKFSLKVIDRHSL